MEPAEIQSIEKPIVGRFAPSPSGRIHAGNVFAYMAAWLLAKSKGGSIVLRIEDLDPQRSRPEYADQILRDFEYLGLTWDRGPYFQNTRTEAYEDAFERLEKVGEVYPCFCSRADLHAASAPHKEERALYPGTCKRLSAQERDTAAQGRAAAYRLSVPSEVFQWHDAIQGVQSFDIAKSCGDFIVRRSDGVFAYQLAVVADDAEQGVNQVARGCDLLESTPQQMLLQTLLGYDRPAYAHIPIFVDETGRKLSKRNRNADMGALLQRFGSPKALVGHIAGVSGLMPTSEPCSMEELLQSFTVDALKGKRTIVWR